MANSRLTPTNKHKCHFFGIKEAVSLLNDDDSFKKIIIVNDYIKPKRNEAGIVTIGLIDFLLKPELLNW